MSAYSVRVYGDPVLKQVARDVDQFDGSLARLVEDMVETMYDSEGAGLAAPQVGVQKRLFVYDVGEGPQAIVNPTIVETDGEWYYDEGCLSIPGLRLGLVRPDRVHLRGHDIHGEELSIALRLDVQLRLDGDRRAQRGAGERRARPGPPRSG